MEAPTLRGERVLLRALTETDVDPLVEISRTPEVARWWQCWKREYAEGKLEDEDVACWAVELDGAVIGFVQAYEETDPEYRHAGIDLFLDPRHHGRGLGREVVRAVAGHLFETVGHHRLVIDPAAANAPAIRCYEAVGFRRVGVTRASWWDHVEERWADGLLLDLLRGELG
jgi:aminoglycoside 6'-N-acetyltransferase